MKNYCLTVLFLFSSLASFCQYYSHQSFQAHEMGMINPAWYSRDNTLSVHATGMRFSGAEGAPLAYSFGGAIPVGTNSSVGLNMNHYSIGPQSKLSVSSFFAYSFKVSDRNQFLSAFLSVGFDRHTLDADKLIPVGDIVLNGKIHSTEAVLGFGAMFYVPEKYFIGFSMPTVSLQELGLKKKDHPKAYSANYYLMAGYLGKLNEVLKIKPVVTVALFEENKNASFVRQYNSIESSELHSNIDISTVLYLYDTYGIGVNYNTDERIGAYASYHANDNLKFSLAWSSYVGNAYSVFDNADFKLGVSYRFGKEALRKLL